MSFEMRQDNNYSTLVLFTFIASHAVNHLFQLVLPTMLPSITADLQLSYYSAGILVACFAVSYSTLQVPVGYLSDRIGRKKIMIAGSLIFAGAMFASGFSTDLIQLSMAQVVAGVGGATFHPVGMPLLSLLVRRERLGRSMGFLQMGGALGSLVAPLASVYFASLLGWRYGFIILSPLGVLTALLAWVCVREPASKPSTQGLAGGRFDYGLVALLTIFSLAWLFGFRGVTAFLTSFAVKKYHVNLEYAAFLLAILQVAGIFSGPLFGHLSDSLGRKRMLITTVLFQGMLVFALTMSPLEVLPLVLLAFGFLAYGSIAVSDATVTGMNWGSALGTFFGIYITASFLSGAIAPPMMGYLVDRISFEFAFNIAAIPTLLSVPLILLALRRRESDTSAVQA